MYKALAFMVTLTTLATANLLQDPKDSAEKGDCSKVEPWKE